MANSSFEFILRILKTARKECVVHTNERRRLRDEIRKGDQTEETWDKYEQAVSKQIKTTNEVFLAIDSLRNLQPDVRIEFKQDRVNECPREMYITDQDTGKTYYIA